MKYMPWEIRKIQYLASFVLLVPFFNKIVLFNIKLMPPNLYKVLTLSKKLHLVMVTIIYQFKTFQKNINPTE